jgi:hypothetical protein
VLLSTISFIVASVCPPSIFPPSSVRLWCGSCLPHRTRL